MEPEDNRFKDKAVVIARDIARMFSGDTRVDVIRLQIAEVLRNYARKDPELGYTQGMCFAAAFVCLSGSAASAEQRFGELMGRLRQLWLPEFHMVTMGADALQDLLARNDPELCEKLTGVSLDLKMVVLDAWLRMFGTWLPLQDMIRLVPFLCSEGVAGFLAVTYVVLLHHREALLECQAIDDTFRYIKTRFIQAPPEDVVGMCRLSLPLMQGHLCSGIVQRVPSS